jgi:hypothetical protein
LTRRKKTAYRRLLRPVMRPLAPAKRSKVADAVATAPGAEERVAMGWPSLCLQNSVRSQLMATGAHATTCPRRSVADV